MYKPSYPKGWYEGMKKRKLSKYMRPELQTFHVPVLIILLLKYSADYENTFIVYKISEKSDFYCYPTARLGNSFGCTVLCCQLTFQILRCLHITIRLRFYLFGVLLYLTQLFYHCSILAIQSLVGYVAIFLGFCSTSRSFFYHCSILAIQ